MDEDFPTDITPEEAAAGFKLIKIKNPMGHYGFGPREEIQAVVLDLGHGRRAKKMRDPVGEIVYAIHDKQDRVVPLVGPAYTVAHALALCTVERDDA